MDKKKLGEGSYGSVTKATNISTKARRLGFWVRGFEGLGV